MTKKGIEGGNLHPVKPGEYWRVQTLRNPYMCPLLEESGTKFNPCQKLFLTIERDHLVDGKLIDNCCYKDVEILEVNDEVILLKTLPLEEDPLYYLIFEVLNDDTIVRFYNRTK